MKVALAADHAGFELKDLLSMALEKRGHEVIDLGTHDRKPVDYSDFAEAVGQALRQKRAERGVLICGSGVGVSVAANKIPGVRAALCQDYYSAHQGVEHDDMNVICLGARIVGPELALELSLAFVSARFNGEERHRRRLEKVIELERKYSKEEMT